MKFKVAFYKNGNYLIKMVLDNGEEIWAKTTKEVHDYAKKMFKENEECEYDYEEKNGEYTINRILKKGKGTTTKKTATKTSSKTSKYTCEDCGASLKDDKYKKCYACNQKTAKTSSSGRPDYGKGAPYGSLLPEEQTRRNKLALTSSVCSAIQVMEGQIGDADTLADMIIVVYDKLYKKLFG